MGSAWIQIQTFSPNLEVVVLVEYGLVEIHLVRQDRIDFITISTRVDATDFGDLTQAVKVVQILCIKTRGFMGGGGGGGTCNYYTNYDFFINR